VIVENVNHPSHRTTVDAEKYETVKRALLATLPRALPGLTQAEMVDGVADRLSGELRQKAGWWTKCVHLDLEAKGVVVRDGKKPLRWRRT
jgi:hypothetical protein